jgi:hypothetical protein
MLQAPDENVAFGTDVFIVATLDGNRVQNGPYAIGFSSLRDMNVTAILPNALL